MKQLAMLPAALALAATTTATTAAPPSGSLLWANVSEAGLGASFASAVALPTHADVLLLGSGATVQRLHPPTGKLLWSTPLSQLGLPSVRGAQAATLAVGPTLELGRPSSKPIALVWSSNTDSTAAAAVDVESGQPLWSAPLLLPFDELGKFSFEGGVFLGFGQVGSVAASRAQATAVALTRFGHQTMFNVTVASMNANCSDAQSEGKCKAQQGCSWDDNSGGRPRCVAVGDWYASVASLQNYTTASGGQQQLALLGTVSGDDSASGSLYALNPEDGSVLWTAPNITATHLHVSGDVLVVSADSRPWGEGRGGEGLFCLIRGYAMSSGDLLWQRTVHDGTNGDGSRGVELGRACEADCTLPCQLVVAGVFGAVDPQTGLTEYNLSATPGLK